MHYLQIGSMKLHVEVQTIHCLKFLNELIEDSQYEKYK